MASKVSKLTKLMNQTSISSLKSAIKPSTSCKPTPLFRQFSLFRSPLELGATQLMMPLLSAGKMSACMSTSTKSGKSAKKGKSRNTGRVRSAPENPKFPKEHKGTMKGIAHKGNYIAFGKYALQALDHSWISARQLEAGRKALVQYARRNGKIWIRIFPRKPITIRPAETRMGRGKGACAFWVAVVQPGRILYEMAGVTESIARLAIKVAASKMPVKTRFISLE